MSPTIRDATDADMRLVHSSWHTAYWKTHAHKHITREVYGPAQDRRIDRLVGQSRVLVAFFDEVPDEVLGWACLQGSTLHYVYVRGSYRRRGIASGLVSGLAKWYTHATDSEGRIFAEKLHLTYNPYRLEIP